MPHIVLEKAKNVKACYDALETSVEKIEGGILKITDKYLNIKERSALIESVAVDKGKSQSFLYNSPAKVKPSPLDSSLRPILKRPTESKSSWG